MFAMSRRATQVNNDLEMIEAVSLMGNGAQSYRRMRSLRPGTYFGEYSCLLGLQRSITVVATDFVEVFALMRADLEAILQDWPSVEREFRSLVSATSFSSAPASVRSPSMELRSSPFAAEAADSGLWHSKPAVVINSRPLLDTQSPQTARSQQQAPNEQVLPIRPAALEALSTDARVMALKQRRASMSSIGFGLASGEISTEALPGPHSQSFTSNAPSGLGRPTPPR